MECIGFDPGGQNAFGWCAANFAGDLCECVGGAVSSATEAVEAACNALKAVPAAIGVDAPLFWTAGDRAADQLVRALVGGSTRRLFRPTPHRSTVG